MDYHALVVRSGDTALLSPPTTICRSWHPSEDPDLESANEELAVELDLHAWLSDVPVLFALRTGGGVRAHH